MFALPTGEVAEFGLNFSAQCITLPVGKLKTFCEKLFTRKALFDFKIASSETGKENPRSSCKEEAIPEECR